MGLSRRSPTSRKNGRKVHAWIVRPPDFNASKKYPLIHGGPFANYGGQFDLEKQLLAASGLVVLYTNPHRKYQLRRGFRNLIHHAYPGDDSYDLNSGVDAMIAKRYIDAEQTVRTAARRRYFNLLDRRPDSAFSGRR